MLVMVCVFNPSGPSLVRISRIPLQHPGLSGPPARGHENHHLRQRTRRRIPLMTQAGHNPMIAFIIEVIDVNRTVVATFKSHCTLSDGVRQMLPQLVIETMASIPQGTIITPREKTEIIGIRHFITIRSHRRRFKSTKIISRINMVLIAFVIEIRPVVSQFQAFRIASLVLIAQSSQKIIITARLQVIGHTDSGLRGRVVFYQNLCCKVLYMTSQVILAPPHTVYVHHRQSPVLTFHYIDFSISAIGIRHDQLSCLHTTVGLGVIGLPSTLQIIAVCLRPFVQPEPRLFRRIQFQSHHLSIL